MINQITITEEEIKLILGTSTLINEDGVLVHEGIKDLALKAKNIMKSKLGNPILAAITKAQIKGMSSIGTLDDLINKYAPVLKTQAGKTALLTVMAGTAAMMGNADLAAGIAKAGVGLAVGDSKEVQELFLGVADAALSENKNPNVSWRQYNLCETLKSEITLKLSEYVSETDLDEGISDKLLPYILAGTAAMGSLSSAQAKPLSPEEVKSQITQALNKGAAGKKDRFNLNLKFFEYDTGIDDLSKDISTLTKLNPEKNEKEIIKIIATGIVKLTGDGKMTKSDAFEAAESSVEDVIRKSKDSSDDDINVQDFETGNPRMSLINDLGGIAAAALTGGDLKKSIDVFFKSLISAFKNKDISKKEVKSILNIMNSDAKTAVKISKVAKILKKGVNK